MGLLLKAAFSTDNVEDHLAFLFFYVFEYLANMDPIPDVHAAEEEIRVLYINRRMTDVT